ncbi:hypothetical protein ACFVZH_39680 [Streptomyces sp. NPDC059534]|uniref:hypothetical protein n=1 Tax=Streptomyces sp. NPDC059534 TaxID=3346859 RepID=UPI0036800026
MRAVAFVQNLSDELQANPGDVRRERTYLVHRAALADRATTALVDVESPKISEQDADDTARRLLDHDRIHGTGFGTVPATAIQWDGNPRGYVHQEHAILAINENLQDRIVP